MVWFQAYKQCFLGWMGGGQIAVYQGVDVAMTGWTSLHPPLTPTLRPASCMASPGLASHGTEVAGPASGTKLSTLDCAIAVTIAITVVILENPNGLQKGPAERGHVKKRQKSSKSAKNFSTLFDNFRTGQKRQKSSKSVKKLFDTFRQFSRGTILPAPFGRL